MKRKTIMLLKGIPFLFALLFCTLLHAQDRKITGTVLSQEDNTPLAGVTVTVKGKKTCYTNTIQRNLCHPGGERRCACFQFYGICKP